MFHAGLKMMDKARIHAAARKALMTADKNYYSWSAQQQEHFRATMDDGAQSRVEAVLLKELMGIRCTAKDAGEIWHDLPLSELNTLNWAKLLTTGIGDDWLFLNEGMAENTSLLDFETLYDYDYADHLFQEQANKQEFKDYQARDYYALRWPRWVRLIIDERFYYATFNSLAGYLIDGLEDKGHDWIQTLIPHEYVEGKEHGKPEKGGFNWDMRTDAAGLEHHLDELKNRWHDYTQQRWLALSREFIQHAPAVYVNETHRDGELYRDFIFTNENTLKCIRWRHFQTDCESLLVDMASITQRAEQETAHAKLWLQETHADNMKNFDPAVVKLKKKRKIVIAPGAFDGLRQDDKSE
jgi:hypothetical protein